MKDKITTILKEIRPEFDFTENVNFIDEGMLDSFDVVTLVTTLDKEYHISIDGLDIVPDNFSSIDSIRALLKKNGVNDES
ncbi:MAG TPA: acyl carrier protein [Hanamia sp.]|nr:acyl carrier protein [Hanamia sp.]